MRAGPLGKWVAAVRAWGGLRSAFSRSPQLRLSHWSSEHTKPSAGEGSRVVLRHHSPRPSAQHLGPCSRVRALLWPVSTYLCRACSGPGS